MPCRAIPSNAWPPAWTTISASRCRSRRWRPRRSGGRRHRRRGHCKIDEEPAACRRPVGGGILAPSKFPLERCAMLYELRRYDVAASKLPALVDRFGSFTVAKWKEYGFRLIGFWTPVVSEKSNQVVYIWGWESYEERTKKIAAWRADPERVKKWAETEAEG